VGLGVGSGVGVTAGSSTFAMFRKVAAQFFATDFAGKAS
jgi:hypothetical protein